MTRQPNIELLTPQQRNFLSSVLTPETSELSGQAYRDFLQPESNYEDLFQKSVVDPTMMQYQRQILPSIQERFMGGDTKASGALNQALAQSATDLSTVLGSQYANFYNQQQANKLSALGGLSGMAGQQTFQPVVAQQGGILGPLLSVLSGLGAGTIFSTKKVKENIKDFKDLGLKDIKKLNLKIYDHKKEFGGRKENIGFIAEELPKQITIMKDGYLNVDIYALLGVAIRAIQELNDKVEKLEAK